MTESPATSPPAPRAAGWIKLVVALAAVVALVLLGRQAGGYVNDFANWVDGLGAWGPVVFVVGYAVATVAFIPGSLLTMTGGAVFGLLWGTLYVFLGAVLGTAAAFLIARYLARRAIERKLEAHDGFQAIDRAVGKQGRKIVFLLRLSPVFPYNLLNYALGLTQVRLTDYLIASIGMLPGTFLYVYYGTAIGSIAALAAGAQAEQGAERWWLLGLGLAATVVVTILITRIARRALQEATDG